jgi:hypothetical protein
MSLDDYQTLEPETNSLEAFLRGCKGRISVGADFEKPMYVLYAI